MAVERFGMLCPICEDAFFLGKHFYNGIYTNDHLGFDRMNLLQDWMWKHLLNCHKRVEFADERITLFEVVPEGDPRVDMRNHWNRHKPEDFSE